MYEIECLDLCVLLQVISLYPPGICALLSGAKQLTLLHTHTPSCTAICVRTFIDINPSAPYPNPNSKLKTKF